MKIVPDATLIAAWIAIAADDVLRLSVRTLALCACLRRRAWIAIAAEEMTTLDAIAIYIFLGMQLIAVIVLFMCFILIQIFYFL